MVGIGFMVGSVFIYTIGTAIHLVHERKFEQQENGEVTEWRRIKGEVLRTRKGGGLFFIVLEYERGRESNFDRDRLLEDGQFG